jgi:DNA-binding CsgD family transcriptional regulator
MTSEGALLRVAGKLQEAALHSEAWPEALSSFGALFASTWTVVGAFERDPRAKYSLLTQDAAGDPEHLVFFRDHYNTPDTNPALERLAAASPGAVNPREQTFSDREWRMSPFYKEIYQPRGLFHGLGMCVINDESFSAIVGVNRARAAGRFSEREIEALRQAAPHLQRALEVSLRIAPAQARNRAHESAWELLSCGVLLLDRSGAILWTNTKARTLLEAADGLVVRNGRLTAAHASDAAVLASAIRDALLARRDRGPRPGGALRVSRRSRKRALSVLVSPLRIEHCFVRAPAAVVFVTDPEWKSDSPAKVYRRLYDLTNREATVAASLTAGAGLAETAAELGISIHTARTHLRGLFRKTETRRQGELIATLARATLGFG